MKRVQVVWYHKDLKVIEAALKMYQEACQDVVKDPNIPTKHKRESLAEEVVCIDLQEHITWLVNKDHVKDTVKIKP